ncbi:hypothetical protein GUITHDRAFT_141484 [Guillardia theta CCMP2712]|uniref:Uncharacterized protein n=1 Tax=Guillardia theta (strain CCMP2712) TaxID=905079 RepID=L1J1I7_GUITC|nr:hypothetical protein GUITHDRAFT_141484 [Guillardia theta CCMP2712]EKX42004.1 hypothetical protein GUITHDRAFT_141484 [Guillardia theta CCMP2712]|eukprot:XP_005828984.1 hypothetical protein GUITHDRAFT_141484 [Guillardia theta CCMP2712]
MPPPLLPSTALPFAALLLLSPPLPAPPRIQPAAHSLPLPAWLRCILYCEFDPHRGPRPVFQAPENLVSADTCDYLSDHLIASSELCGHLISVTAFGLRFVGHPEHIRDEHYERNQFMFNVCFVFDATTDVSAYQPIVKQVASDFRLMETQHRFLSSQSNHEQTQAIIQGIIHDINTLGQFSMPPTGVSDIPYFPKNNPEPIRLQQVWVASKDSIKLADPLLLKLVSFFDGVSDIMTISIKSEMELEFVLAKVSWLLQREMEVVRMIDKIRLK